MDNIVEDRDAIRETIGEAIEELYDMNSKISLFFIGMRKIPTEEQMGDINQRIGKVIKKLREISQED